MTDGVARVQALAVDGKLPCPLCAHVVLLPTSGLVTLRAFDQWHGHLLAAHDLIAFAEALLASTGWPRVPAPA